MKAYKWTALLWCLLMLVVVSCQPHYVSGRKLGLRDYPDSVVHINQVDPAYRSYFAAQHGSSFSLRDQRKAFTAANQTARTPVRESAYKPVVKASRKKTASRGKKYSSRKKTASRKKTTSRKKTSSRKKTKTSKRSSTRRRR